MSLTICDRIWEVAGRRSTQPFTLEFVIMAAWEILNIRNSVIFDNGVATPHSWLRKFKSQGYLHLVRVGEDACSSFIQFLESIT
jgi:hypothetical protein